MLCEEGMTTIEAKNALSIPQNIEQTLLIKTQSNTGKIDKHCTNCGMINHNVETYKRRNSRP
jgi:hypothetical protein